jgi:hypothetical protein
MIRFPLFILFVSAIVGMSVDTNHQGLDSITVGIVIIRMLFYVSTRKSVILRLDEV